MIVDGISLQAPLRNHSESYPPRLYDFASIYFTSILCFTIWNHSLVHTYVKKAFCAMEQYSGKKLKDNLKLNFNFNFNFKSV